jgi:hypothetical protein
MFAKSFTKRKKKKAMTKSEKPEQLILDEPIDFSIDAGLRAIQVVGFGVTRYGRTYGEVAGMAVYLIFAHGGGQPYSVDVPGHSEQLRQDEFFAQPDSGNLDELTRRLRLRQVLRNITGRGVRPVRLPGNATPLRQLELNRKKCHPATQVEKDKYGIS